MWLISEPRCIHVRASWSAGRLYKPHTANSAKSKPTTLDSDITATSRWEAIFTHQREHQRVDETAITRLRSEIAKLIRVAPLRPYRSEPGARQGARSRNLVRRDAGLVVASVERGQQRDELGSG